MAHPARRNPISLSVCPKEYTGKRWQSEDVANLGSLPPVHKAHGGYFIGFFKAFQDVHIQLQACITTMFRQQY